VINTWTTDYLLSNYGAALEKHVYDRLFVVGLWSCT
jgi:hypothetical protein